MATKIKDGLFIGDAEASQDPEFIELNKITFVINCAGRQLPNLWEQHGLHYLTFPWGSDPDCVLFDSGNIVIEQITHFIDEALEKGDSVLVHSLDGTGRCVACLTAYLMFRHRWGFEKALDFVCSKRLDVSPNPGFIQQLYHLDLRLCAQWFGPGMEPPKEDRIRHDQWMPPTPISALKSEQPQQQPSHVDSPTRRRDVTTSGRARDKHRVIENGRGVRRPSNGFSLPSVPLTPLALSGLSEVQEEELVLVHSFLNSQAQIRALPAGRAEYEDHVPKELHWIDRPRIDKLAAAGRLGTDERRPHLVPVSPGTGRPVPERPSNSSYNALTRDTNPLAKNGFVIVGILKQSGKRSAGSKAGDPQASGSPGEQSGRREVDVSCNGDVIAACVPEAGGQEGEAQALKFSARAGLAAMRDTGLTNTEGEVVVEDMSEARSDQPSCTTATDGGDLGKPVCGRSSRGQEAERRDAYSYAGETAGPPLEGHDLSERPATVGKSFTNRFSEHVPTEPEEVVAQRQALSRRRQIAPEKAVPDVVGGVRYACASVGGSSGEMPANMPGKGKGDFSRVEEMSAAAVTGVSGVSRHGDRQAWDGGTEPEIDVGETQGQSRHSSCRQSATERSHHLRSNGQANSPRHVPMAPMPLTTASHSALAGAGDLARQSVTTRSPTPRELEFVSDPKREDAALMDHASADGTGSDYRGVGGIQGSLGSTQGIRAAEAVKMLLTKPKACRVGSEGSLTLSENEIPSFLPQAPGRSRGSLQAKTQATDPPGPGWGQELAREQTSTEAQRRASCADKRETEGGPTKEIGLDLYPGRSGAGSLQELAQTPNPLQRRLPSPRPQQDSMDQGTRRQHPSVPNSVSSPTKRPSSAPSQRPDQPETSANPTDNSTDGRTTSFAGIAKATAAAPPSERVGTANQGYPVHGLMPSGSALQLHEQVDRHRWGPAGVGGVRPQPLHVPVGTGVGRSNGAAAGGGYRAISVASSPISGEPRSSAESSRPARVSSVTNGNTEIRTTGGHPASSVKSSSGGSPLPREIRTSSESSHSRGIGLAAARTNNRSQHPTAGSDSASPQLDRTGGSRRGSGDSGAVSYKSQSGLVRPAAGTLPHPSRRSSGDSGKSSEDERWANPAPRRRKGAGSAADVVHYSYVDTVNNAGGGNGRSRGGLEHTPSSQNATDSYSTAFSYGQNASSYNGASKSRAGGAPTYRSGSPAPTRGRRKGPTAMTGTTPVATAVDASIAARYLHQHSNTYGGTPPVSSSAMSPAFRGYIASTVGRDNSRGVRGRDGVTNGRPLRRGPSPSPTSGRDRRRSRDRDNSETASGARRPSMTAKMRSGLAHGQRPSTAEGLANGDGGGGRRGRSPSPALRPSSASGRRRSASPAPGANGSSFIRETQRMGVPIDVDRPRWK